MKRPSIPCRWTILWTHCIDWLYHVTNEHVRKMLEVAPIVEEVIETRTSIRTDIGTSYGDSLIMFWKRPFNLTRVDAGSVEYLWCDGLIISGNIREVWTQVLKTPAIDLRSEVHDEIHSSTLSLGFLLTLCEFKNMVNDTFFEQKWLIYFNYRIIL